MTCWWKRALQEEKQEERALQVQQQFRFVKTAEAEAGALGRYREPILTADLQCVVLPWITPSRGRRAEVRMEGGGDGNKIHSWTGAGGAAVCGGAAVGAAVRAARRGLRWLEDGLGMEMAGAAGLGTESGRGGWRLVVGWWLAGGDASGGEADGAFHALGLPAV